MSAAQCFATDDTIPELLFIWDNVEKLSDARDRALADGDVETANVAAGLYVAFLVAYFLMQIIVDNELDNNDRHLMASFAFGMAFLWNRAYLAYHRVPSALRRHLQVVQQRSRAGSVRVLFPSQTLWKIATVMEQVAALTQWERTRFHAWGTAGLEHFFGDTRGKARGDQRYERLARLAFMQTFAPSLRAEAGFAEYHPRRRSQHSEAPFGGGIDSARFVSMDQVFVHLLALIRTICPYPDFDVEFEEELQAAGCVIPPRPFVGGEMWPHLLTRRPAGVRGRSTTAAGPLDNSGRARAPRDVPPHRWRGPCFGPYPPRMTKSSGVRQQLPDGGFLILDEGYH